MLRPGALVSFKKQVAGMLVSIHFYSKSQSMFCPVYLHCCRKLSNHMHHGIQQGGREVMIYSWTGFNHGQILIETATHSLGSKEQRKDSKKQGAEEIK